MRTASSDWRQINGKLAGWIAVTGMEGFAKTRSPLYQFTLLTLRAVDGCLIRFIDRFRVITCWIVATANKHAKTALT